MDDKTKSTLTLLAGTCCYAGYSPLAPGTVATLVLGIPFFLILVKMPYFLYGMICVGIFAVGCKVSGEIEKMTGETDPSKIVIDELLGYLVTMAGLQANFTTIILGFFAFRLFDIIKPWPIRTMETQLSGGLGVMTDDLAAGLYAGILVRLALHFMS